MMAQKEGQGRSDGSVVKLLAIEGMRFDPSIHVKNKV